MTLPLMGGVAARGADTRAHPVIVTFGDSTTAPRGNLAIYAQRLDQVLARQGIPATIINAGVGGNTTSMARRRFETDVLRHNPKLVIIQFGINDSAVDVYKQPPATLPRVPFATYRDNLLYFIATLKGRGTQVILMTPNLLHWTPNLKELYGKPPYNPDDPDGFNLYLRDYAQAVRDIAKEQKVPLVDIYKAYEDYAKDPGRTADELLLDGMHPNAKGHQLVTERLMGPVSAALTK